MRDWGNKFQYPIPNDQIEFVWNLILRTLDSLECERCVIASEAPRRPAFRGIQGEAKQSPEIATSSRQSGTPRNDDLWSFEVDDPMVPLITSI